MADLSDFIERMEKNVPGGIVRTRFAPSPTGYMHVGGLRTALYAWLIARKSKGAFILRIEDTDKARYVDGATEIIKSTLAGAGLYYDEGPDIGGPCAPYTQSERKEIYKPYAKLLCRKGAAYYCFCDASDDEISSNDKDDKYSKFDGVADPCRDLRFEESEKRADDEGCFVIRMKAPTDGETTVIDEVFGEITTQNKEIEDMVLIKRDGLPTYNFANVIDDHLMGITHVLRGSEYITSAPKYNLLYNAFGWQVPKYVTVSLIMRDANNKFSKRKGDPTYDDLISEGYLPGAVINYIALLGWSPGGEREIFSLQEMIEAFDISGISKAPAIFDIVKLNHFNSEYIRALPLNKFVDIAMPYIKKSIQNTNYSIEAVAKILQQRLEKLGDIPEKIDFFDSLPEYDISLYTHKKSKTDEHISHKVLVAAKEAFLVQSDFTTEAIHDLLLALAEKLEVKNATLMYPIRIAVSGKAVTPGGAVEICAILGKEEVLRRIDIGISKLRKEGS